MHAVHPARVVREAHDEERVVRQRDALCRTPHPRRTPAFTIAVERSKPARTDDVFLRPERHGTLRCASRGRRRPSCLNARRYGLRLCGRAG
jgi:hypothetical protein